MNEKQDAAESGPRALQDGTGITRRNVLRGLGVMAAAPAGAAAAVAAEDAPAPAAIAPVADLVDEHFASASGRHFGSQIIHHGEQPGYQVTPISQDKAAPTYQRPGNLSNPTVAALLRKVMEMEGTEAAAGGPCGMGIISQTYLALLRPGDRLVAHRCNYDWVMTLFRDYLPSWGVEVAFVDMTDPENLAKSLRVKPAKIVHWEPYVNPTMEVLDTPALIQIAKQAGATVILDNTWLTPYLLQPFRLGADLVIHSVTKYMGGHGNAMGGVVSGRKELVAKIERAQNWLGGLLRPMEAFLVTQGVKTLPLRMRQHCRSAQLVAEFRHAGRRVEGRFRPPEPGPARQVDPPCYQPGRPGHASNGSTRGKGPRHSHVLHARIGRSGRAGRSDCRFQASDRTMWLEPIR